MRFFQFGASVPAFLLVFAMSCCFVSTAAHAQYYEDDENPKNSIKLNMGSIFLLHLNLQYQRVLTDKFAVQVAVGGGGITIPMPSFINDAVSKIDYSDFKVTPEFRWYFLPRQSAPNGLYVAPFAQWQSYNLTLHSPEVTIKGATTEKYGSIYANINSIGGGVAIGYQIILGKHFTADLLVGPSYTGSLLSVRSKLAVPAQYRQEFIDRFGEGAAGATAATATSTLENYANTALSRDIILPSGLWLRSAFALGWSF